MVEQRESVVCLEQVGHVLILTINRPEARNAINEAVHVALGTALDAAESDPDVRCVILTGAGEKSFCAGADLKALSRGEQIVPSNKSQAKWGFAGVVAHPISKPLIAAVNGVALGGGTELALAADLVVAADSAQFGLPEVKRGLIAAGGGAFRILKQMPTKLAMELLLTGDSIDASRAQALGFINLVVPREQVLLVAIELAEKIARNAPLAVQASKRLATGIVEGQIALEASAWEQNGRELADILRSQDLREGTLAFAEKRAPVWTGR